MTHTVKDEFVNETEAQTRVDAARDLARDGRYQDGLAAIQALYDKALPSSARGRSLAIEVVCLEGMDRVRDAEDLIVDNMKEEGDDLGYILAAGTQFSELDALHHGETFLRNLCELDPDNAVGWYNLAVCLGRADRYYEAIEFYDEALKRDPAFSAAYQQKAFCLAVTGETRQAAAAYRSYLDFEPSDGETWLTLGELENGLGNREGADDAFRKALEAGADAEDVYYTWALSATRQRNTERLDECVEKLASLDEDGWRSLLARAYLEELRGDVWAAWETVASVFTDMFEEGDEDEEVMEHVVCALLRFANRNAMQVHAETYIDQLFEREFFTEETLNLMRLLEGRFSNAVRSYQVALQATPENVDPSEPPLYRICGVAAESSEAAAHLAAEFQARCDGYAWDVVSIHCLSEPDEGVMGVYWLSPVLDALPTSGNAAT